MKNDDILKISIGAFVMLVLGTVITIMLFVPIPTANNTILTTMLTLIVRDFGNIVRSIYKLVSTKEEEITDPAKPTE